MVWSGRKLQKTAGNRRKPQKIARSSFDPFLPFSLSHRALPNFSPGCLCNSVRNSPHNVQKIARFPRGETGAESCHVFGCHGFSFPKGYFESHRNARLFIILFVRNFWRLCPQFWLSVHNSVSGPLSRNPRGNPSRHTFGRWGVKGHQNCEQTFGEQTGVS